MSSALGKVTLDPPAQDYEINLVACLVGNISKLFTH